MINNSKIRTKITNKWLKRLLIKITLALFTLLLCIAAIESFFRVRGHYLDLPPLATGETVHAGNLSIIANGREVLYQLEKGYPLTPNLTVVYSGYISRLPTSIISTNSEGLRDVDHNVTKPMNTIRIISLGDSIAFGEGVNLEYTYGKVLERMLNNLTMKKYEVLNFGRFGYGTMDELRLFIDKGLKFEPDIVLLMMVDNDYSNIGDIQQDNYFLEKIRVWTQNSSLLMSQWLEKRITVMEYRATEAFNDNDEKLAMMQGPLQALIKLCNNNSIQLVVALYGAAGPCMVSVKDELLQQEIPVFDVRNSTLLWDYSLEQTNFPDGHPTVLGHKIIADIIYDNLFRQKVINQIDMLVPVK